MTMNDLLTATGLSSEELAQVLANNPRAYMAVRGAVAEKHLEKELDRQKKAGRISSVRAASGDLDKDFYIEVNGRVLSMECKNVEVIKTANKKMRCRYLRFLIDEQLLDTAHLNSSSIEDLPASKVKAMFDSLPQTYRESGMARFRFSASIIPFARMGSLNDEDYLQQFEEFPLSIDFQRTRNSTDEDGDTKRQRFYKTNEIDLVGACLFSRTLEWKFMYARASKFDVHKKYADRFANGLKLVPGVWYSNLEQLLSAEF